MNPSPGAPVLPQVLVKILAALVMLAGVVVSLPATGIQLPPLVSAIAAAIVSLGAAFGILSPGARKVVDAQSEAGKTALALVPDKAAAVDELNK